MSTMTLPNRAARTRKRSTNPIDKPKADACPEVPRSSGNRLVRHHELLAGDKERKLAARIKKGDKSARETLIQSNLRLVVCLAKRYESPNSSREDLIQEGIKGLIRAVDDFDPKTHGTRFSTYAAYWIVQAIHRYLVANFSLIRTPEYLFRVRADYHRVMGQLTTRATGAGESDEAESRESQVACRLKIAPKRLRFLHHSMINQTSNTITDEDGRECSIEAMILDTARPDQDLERAEEIQQLRCFLGCLTPLEAWVICSPIRPGRARCRARRIADPVRRDRIGERDCQRVWNQPRTGSRDRESRPRQATQVDGPDLCRVTAGRRDRQSFITRIRKIANPRGPGGITARRSTSLK